jgi:subtilisin family serine protease
MTKIAGGTTDAWSKFTDLELTSSTKVAVIDTGVDISHPDLAGKIDAGDWIVCSDTTSPNCIPTTGGVDDNGHGTHVAGIIAATGNNGVGIAGAGAGTKIMSIKALNSQGEGSLTSVLYGAAYALDHGVKIINFSLGAPETVLSADQIALIQTAINQIWGAGGLLVVAGGNCGDGVDSFCAGTNPKMYPAASDNVLSVGAVTNTGGLASYSAHGDWVKVAAPGGSCTTNNEAGCILSTWSSAGASCPTVNSPAGYCYDQGTSMSAPFVSAIAALLLSKYPNLTNQNLMDIIDSSAVTGSTGARYGMVDAAAALTLADSYSSATPTTIPTPTPGFDITPTIIIVPTATTAPTNTTPSPTTGAILIIDSPRLAKSQQSIPSGALCNSACTLRPKGDANCDGVINAIDIDAWARHFDTVISAESLTPNANFICTEGNLLSNYIDLVDFEAWRRNTSQFLP